MKKKRRLVGQALTQPLSFSAMGDTSATERKKKGRRGHKKNKISRSFLKGITRMELAVACSAFSRLTVRMESFAKIRCVFVCVFIDLFSCALHVFDCL